MSEQCRTGDNVSKTGRNSTPDLDTQKTTLICVVTKRTGCRVVKFCNMEEFIDPLHLDLPFSSVKHTILWTILIMYIIVGLNTYWPTITTCYHNNKALSGYTGKNSTDHAFLYSSGNIFAYSAFVNIHEFIHHTAQR